MNPNVVIYNPDKFAFSSTSVSSVKMSVGEKSIVKQISVIGINKGIFSGTNISS